METISKCAVCGSETQKPHQEIKDYFLSREIFQMVRCESCGFLFLNPRPSKDEISKYYKTENYISHSDSKRSLTAKIYQKVRNINIAKKYKLISSIIPKGNILDIGCGTGDVLKYFSEKKWDIFGIEPDNDARKIACEKTNTEIGKESDLLTFSDEKFDVITMWHVLEHVHNIDERMTTIHRIIKPDGIFIFSVPINESWDAQHYSNFWAAYDVPRHLSHFTQDTASLLMSRYCFEILKTIPMKFDSYYISLLSEKYKTGKNKFLKGFINGFKSNCKAKKLNGNFSSLIFVCRIK